MQHPGKIDFHRALLLVMGNESPSSAGDAPQQLWRIRAGCVLAGLWYLVFSLPLIFRVLDTCGKGKPLVRALRDVIGQLIQMVRQARQLKGLFRFIIAWMIYIDGLATISLGEPDKSLLAL